MSREFSLWETLRGEPEENPKTPEELAREREMELEKEEEEAREKRYKKAAEQYEEGLKRPFHPEEIEADEKSNRQDKTLIETHKMSGLKSQQARRTWRYGHRHGKKPAKPGREAARKEMRKEAA